MQDLFGLLLGGLARITQGREHSFVLVQILDGGFIGDGQHHLVAAFFALPQHPEFRARRGLRQRLIIPLDVLSVGQLARFAGDAPEKFQRRWHAVRRRHVIHQFGGDARVVQIFLDEARVLLIHFLRRGRRCGRSGRSGRLGFLILSEREGRHRDHRGKSQQRSQSGETRSHWGILKVIPHYNEDRLAPRCHPFRRQWMKIPRAVGHL